MRLAGPRGGDALRSRWTEALGLVLAVDYAQAGLRRALGNFLGPMMSDRIERKLPWIEVPAMVVRGSRDPIVPQRWAEDAVRLLPQGRLRVIPGAPHTINYTTPLEFVRGLLRNVAVALGNGGSPEAVPVRAAALEDEEPLIRGHAAWAPARIGTEGAREALETGDEVEEDAWVREEISLALTGRDPAPEGRSPTASFSG